MKGCIILLLISFFSVQLNAQEYARQPREKKKALAKERFYLGGNFGLWFGTTTYIELSPLLGYKITERWHVGLGLTYIYFKGSFVDLYTLQSYSINTHVYGGRLLTRFYIMENIFAHAEYEVLNLEVPVYDNNFNIVYQRVNVPSFLVGGGYSQKMGTNSAFYILILFNVNQNIYSPYSNPVFRMGFSFGL